MTQNGSPIMKVENVVREYRVGDNVIKALDNVSLEILPGEFSAIVGKSGSGKSTLMHILGLLDTPTSGQVFLNGKDISQLKERRLAQLRNNDIGFVFQQFNLLQRTNVLDNVILPLKYSTVPKSQWKDKAVEMIKLVELEERMYNKSNELSGGQKQRVAIARALVNDPSIILADEPTGNLDSRTGDAIVDFFHKLHDLGRTIILVTHDEELAQTARRQIVLKDGKIISQ